MSTTEMTRPDLGKLANNGMTVQGLQTALSRSETLSNTVPMQIIRLDKDNSWREFLFADRPDVVYRWTAADFRCFIESPRPGGCQTPIHILERLLRGTDAWEVFLRLTRGEPGAPVGNQNAAKQGEETNRDSITDCLGNQPEPIRNHSRESRQGTSVSYALRRLERVRPDLRERVKEGELSAHAAMVEAGLRDKQITVPADPRKAARRLVAHFTREEFSALVDEAIKLYTTKQ